MYIPMAKGISVSDCCGRLVQPQDRGGQGSHTLEARHAEDVLQEAFSRHGVPEIVNTDQGSQFTADDFVQAVKDRGSKLSMDGRGVWRDNVFVERLWRSVKYERVCLHAYDTVSQARRPSWTM